MATGRHRAHVRSSRCRLVLHPDTVSEHGSTAVGRGRIDSEHSQRGDPRRTDGAEEASGQGRLPRPRCPGDPHRARLGSAPVRERRCCPTGLATALHPAEQPGQGTPITGPGRLEQRCSRPATTRAILGARCWRDPGRTRCASPSGIGQHQRSSARGLWLCGARRRMSLCGTRGDRVGAIGHGASSSAASHVGAERHQLARQVVVATVDVPGLGYHRLAFGHETSQHERCAGTQIGGSHRGP